MRSMMNGACQQRDTRLGPSESGVALIMALFALVLLTAVGLTLATSTSTEVQVAANHRWALQALYNAEAGIEVAKNALAGQDVDWKIHPTPRVGSWDPGAITTPATLATATIEPVRVTASARDFEMGNCDQAGNGMGYGVVMPDLRVDNAPLESVDRYPRVGGTPLNGRFTLWYRKPRAYDADPKRGGANGLVHDFSEADAQNYNVVIVVSEGTAPASATFGNQAVQVVEATLYRPKPTNCETDLGGNPGGGPGGAGVNPCERANDTIDLNRMGVGTIVGGGGGGGGGGGQVRRRDNF